MSEADASVALDATWRTERRRVLATLIRLLGSFEAAEEALADAFAAASEQWPRDGVPTNPVSWLISVGRFRTIDRWRRQARLADALPSLPSLAEPVPAPAIAEPLADDELRLIFTCCHPAIVPDARIALTLREVGGLTTEEIARAYLVPAPTIAQRIVRAKSRIRELALPYEVPDRDELPRRTESVMRVIYLVFNEGFAATAGPELTRSALSGEAIRLGRILVGLLPEDPEVLGLMALMLLHEARRSSRTDRDGNLVLLEDQDRTMWDRALFAEANRLIGLAAARRRFGPYLLQAMIAAAHAEAESFAETDWDRIVSLYEVLSRADPSPITELNRAVATGMRDGPEAGLAGVEAAIASGTLDNYHPAHVARADMLRRLGRLQEASAAYERALLLCRQPAERRFLEGRISVYRQGPEKG